MPGRWVRTLSLLALLPFAACRKQNPESQTVIVFAAASLGESFRALEQIYETEHPNVDVVINLAGSQLLARQLIEGASADVFASADQKNLDRVLAERPAVEGSRRVFATNKLVFVVPSTSNVDEFGQIDELLAKPHTKVVLAGPEVPIGRYARKALDELGMREVFEAKLVSNEDSVDGVIAKIELGECDIGIAYVTDLRRLDKLRGISMPDNVDVTASYEIAALADGPNPEQGQAFVSFVTSFEGQALLRDRGFGPPEL